MNSFELGGFGLDDDAFCQEPGVPMTKSELRAIILSKLRLFPGMRLLDIGCGTGTIAVECQRLVPDSHIVALDRHRSAVELTRRNVERFGVQVEVIEGEAPEALPVSTGWDRVFVGGHGGRVEDLLLGCDRLLAPGGRLVMSAVAIDTIPRAVRILQELGYFLNMVQINVAWTKPLGNTYVWQARNPVTILAADGKGT